MIFLCEAFILLKYFIICLQSIFSVVEIIIELFVLTKNNLCLCIIFVIVIAIKKF